MKIAIENARLVDPKNGIDARQNLYLADGKVAAVGQAPDGFAADESIDAAGLVACPGLIDLCAHPLPLKSELAAASAGGVTTLACPPDIDPALDEPELVERLVQQAKAACRVRVLPLGALTHGLKGERLAEMAALHDAGCIAFSQGRAPITDTRSLYRAFEYAATFGFPIWLQAEEFHLSQEGFAHSGAAAARMGLTGIPVAAETVALATYLILARDIGIKLHIQRLSSAAGLAMLLRAQEDGIDVTADVGIHHLHLCENDLGYFDANARFDPPLRAESDRRALRLAAAAGQLAICSDHTPLRQDAKRQPFGDAEPGASALELLLPLTLQWGRESGLPLIEALAPLTALPAAMLGKPELGHLGVGAAADVCLIDTKAQWAATPETLVSRGKNTPFAGKPLKGRAVRTISAIHASKKAP